MQNCSALYKMQNQIDLKMATWQFTVLFYQGQSNEIENIVIHWSVAQAGSSDEKMGVENLVGLSLKEN